jgi:hypothetical protein
MGISTLYSIHRLGMVKEVGEVEEKIVVHEFVSEVRRRMLDVSAVGGLRQMVNFPFLVAKQLSGLMPPNLGVRQGEMKGMAQQRR